MPGDGSAQVKKVFLQRAGIFGAFGSIVNTLKNWDSNNESSMDVTAWGLTPIDTKSHTSFGDHAGDRKYYEYYVEPDDDLFVLGTAASTALFSGEVIMGPALYYHLGLVIAFWFIAVWGSCRRLGGMPHVFAWIAWAI